MDHFWKIWKKKFPKATGCWNHIHKVCVTQIHYVTRFSTLFLLKFLLKLLISVSLKNPHFCLFPGVLHGKLKFQDKFYNIIDHNKWPSSEKQDEKCVFRKSCFHQIQPIHECENRWIIWSSTRLTLLGLDFSPLNWFNSSEELQFPQSWEHLWSGFMQHVIRHPYLQHVDN